jgi:hypothetical protein
MLEAWIFGITVVGGAVLFASLGVLLVRRRVSSGFLRRNHEVAGYLLSIVGTLYSVLLGLIVVDTQAKYQTAKSMTQQEADSCLDLFHISYTMPFETRSRIHHDLQEYLRIVDEEEWDSITKTGEFDESSKTAFRDIWWTITDYEPKTTRGIEAYGKLLDIMQNMADGRRYRLQFSKVGLPEVMWGVVIAGGFLTVLFTYLFEVENEKAQILMTGLVALALSLNVLLIALFSNPYKGYMRISSYAFKYDRRVMIELSKVKHGGADLPVEQPTQ